jgi:hypothetical protein
VLEEADAFASPQPVGNMTRVLGEVDWIARRGPNFGFRLISITQRSATLIVGFQPLKKQRQRFLARLHGM